MQTAQKYEETCRKILTLDKRIRAAALVDITGDKVAIEIREDVVDKKLVPLGTMPRWGHVLGVVPWNAAENLERYFGTAFEVIFRFEKIDFCLMRTKSEEALIEDKLLVLTVEKGTRILELIEEIRRIVDGS